MGILTNINVQLRAQINRALGAESGFEIRMVYYDVEADTFGREESSEPTSYKMSASITFNDGSRLIEGIPGQGLMSSDITVLVEDMKYHKLLAEGISLAEITLIIKDKRTQLETEYKIMRDQYQGGLVHILDAFKKA